MADEADVTLQAADAAAEALAKSQSSLSNAGIDPGREAALDAAFEELSKHPVEPPDPSSPDYGKDNNGVRIPIEGEPTAEERAAEEAAAKEAEAAEKARADAEAAVKPGVPPVKPGEKKGLLDDLVVTPEVKPEDRPDPYDVKLRSDASPKTHETFAQLKAVAKEREAAALKQAEDLRKSLEETQAKVAELEKRTVPDEVQNELKELRSFRAQFDTENDPEFKQKYESRAAQNYDAVYAKLKFHGLPDGEIAKLRAFPPASRDAAIERFLDKIPTMDRRFIEAKLLDNVNVEDERTRALQEARTKADEILAKQKTAPVHQASQRVDQIARLVQPELAKLPWIHTKEIPANAAPEEKKRIEAENATATAMQEVLKTAILDDSPETRARAALSVPLARHYSALYASEKARADALQAKLNAIKEASATSRTARTSASPAATPPPRSENLNMDSGDHLDALFAQETGRAPR